MLLSGFVWRALLLGLVARMAILPPLRATDRPSGRVLLRYCACPGPLRWPSSVAPAGGNDPGAAIVRPAVRRVGPPGGTISALWSLVAPSTPGFLIRPPSHLVC